MFSRRNLNYILFQTRHYDWLENVIIALKTKCSVFRFPPSVYFSFVTQSKTVGNATTYFLNSTNTFNQSWHVATSNNSAVDSQFSLIVRAHGKHLTSLRRLTYENCEVFATRNEFDYYAETANFGS